MAESQAVRILYMEDDPGLAVLLQRNLSREGYSVDIAVNGAEGLNMLASERYDLLLVDYHMPVMGGNEVIRSLSQWHEPPPVIIVTGNGSERVAVESLKLGAADYIVKDAEMGYLALLPIVVGQVLQKQQMLREREQIVAAVQENEERYRKLVELSPDGIAICQHGCFAFVNSAGLSMLGGGRGQVDLLGRKMDGFVHENSREVFTAQLRQLEELGTNVPWMEEKFVRQDGAELDVEVSGVPFHFRGAPAVQIIFRDITERIQARQRLERMAHFDSLTGLPNRSLFFDRLGHLLEQAKRYNYQFALLFLDLDGFKGVNDTFGHDMGDLLLQEVGARLHKCMRRSDTVARMGGDEFTIILSRINEPADAGIAARKVIDSLALPFLLGEQSCSIGASMGISVFPGDGEELEMLLKKADTAMYRVKEAGKNDYRFFADD